jgi:hypothetical protein
MHHLPMRDGDFRVRGKEISRIEGLSDAVFGFAITLLVVSLEVPRTAGEVLHAMRGFLPFAFTFAMLFMVWRTQFTFFRRYGLEDKKTVLLNALLIFTVLFFVYPLKFFFGYIGESLWYRLGYPDKQALSLLVESRARMPELILAYGIGWCVVFLVFSFMYAHAYSKRDELQLTAVEEFDTRESVLGARGSAFVGLMAGVTNFFPSRFPQRMYDAASWGGVVIMLIPLVYILRRRKTRSSRRLVALNVERAIVEA